MKVSDYIIKFLEDSPVDHVFTLSGGGIMYLLDSLGRSKKINYVCNYHEQACAISADAYSRLKGMGVALVTFGPGAVNALSGAVGAWYDSVPMVVISGQVRSDLIADYSKVRQLGPQEGDVISMAGPVTKYAVQLRELDSIKYELQKAFHMAASGRPGPVWIEVPLDIQNADIDVSRQKTFVGECDIVEISNKRNKFIDVIKESLGLSRRPVILAGNGIRFSRMQKKLEALSTSLSVPVLVPCTARSVIGDYHDNFFGVFGTAGQRHSNIILQNADLIISLGVGLSVAKTGFAVDKLSPNAKKLFVDIDEGQLTQHPFKPDMFLVDDLKEFLPEAIISLKDWDDPHREWLELAKYWKSKYPVFRNSAHSQDCVNVYYFINTLSSFLRESDTIIGGNGLDCVSVYQGLVTKKGQEVIINGNWGSMGWDLPQSVGAHYATGNRVVCIAGDGSVQLNCQELLTIGSRQLPIKIFIYNNGGYGSIKATQKAFFEGRFVGSGADSGVCNPDFKMLAQAYGVNYAYLGRDSDVESMVAEILADDSPCIVEIRVSSEQWIEPKATAFKTADGKIESKPLDDMAPFLSPEEVESNRLLALAVGGDES